jgi:hypothetical protein
MQDNILTIYHKVDRLSKNSFKSNPVLPDTGIVAHIMKECYGKRMKRHGRYIISECYDRSLQLSIKNSRLGSIIGLPRGKTTGSTLAIHLIENEGGSSHLLEHPLEF